LEIAMKSFPLKTALLTVVALTLNAATAMASVSASAEPVVDVAKKSGNPAVWIALGSAAISLMVVFYAASQAKKGKTPPKEPDA
jgi:divalent metal cation (Fe/Co/Zn/Cd) transporter